MQSKSYGKKFLLFLVLLIQVLLAFINNYDLVDYLLLMISLVGTVYFFRNVTTLKNNLSLIFFFVFIFCSLHVEALARFQASSFVISGSADNEPAFRDLSRFSNEVLAVFSLSFFFLNKIISRKKSFGKYLYVKPINEAFFDLTLIVAFSFSIISARLGIGKMGYEAVVVLPFHLNGIIQFFRTDIFPLIVAIFFYDRTIHKLPIKSRHILLVILWAVLESFVRLSRGAIVMSFLPLIFMYIYSNQFNRKFVSHVVIPLLCGAIVLFPVISFLRQSGDVSLEAVSNSRYEREDKVGQHIFLRTFYSGIYYIRMYPTGYNDPSLFYWERSPLILALGGSAVYTTRVIDGVSENVLHSSGTTGILDPLLIGGKGLCFVMIFVLVFVALNIDRRIGNERILFKIVCLMFFKILVMSKNITVLLDSEAVQLLTCYLLEFVIVAYYYKKHYKFLHGK